jgi:peptidoglycan hydrolase CwlO-like protein
MFNKLSKEEKDETFLKLYDDYRGVRGALNIEIHKNKRLNAKLRSMEKDVVGLKAGEREPRGRDKEEIKRLHEKIAALTSTNNKPKTQNRPKTANRSQKLIIPANEHVRAEL